ncbi:MAG: proline--tRNA ligase, partial [Clostridia bacterium]|nr:proline--tRNA ligase [Clostridia bacterium]
PQKRSIEEVSEFLNLPAKKFIKTLFYQADEEVIAILVRGDRNINEIKLQRLHPANIMEMASAESVKNVSGCIPGFVGPVGLKNIKIYADEEIKTIVNAVCGANEENYHIKNVQPGRDFEVFAYGDLRLIEEGELCPRCHSKLKSARGIEVGQVFKLGTKYSKALEAKYIDENGKENLMVMGCYGIGISRTVAAAVEQNHDKDGIIWPMSIAPYQVIVTPVKVKDEIIWSKAFKIYQALEEKGVEVILDDRDERAGVKFKDADLIGIPIRVTLGKKYIEENVIEVKLRSEKEVQIINKDDIISHIMDILDKERDNIKQYC